MPLFNIVLITDSLEKFHWASKCVIIGATLIFGLTAKLGGLYSVIIKS